MQATHSFALEISRMAAGAQQVSDAFTVIRDHLLPDMRLLTRVARGVCAGGADSAFCEHVDVVERMNESYLRLQIIQTGNEDWSMVESSFLGVREALLRQCTTLVDTVIRGASTASNNSMFAMRFMLTPCELLCLHHSPKGMRPAFDTLNLPRMRSVSNAMEWVHQRHRQHPWQGIESEVSVWTTLVIGGTVMLESLCFLPDSELGVAMRRELRETSFITRTVRLLSSFMPRIGVQELEHTMFGISHRAVSALRNLHARAGEARRDISVFLARLCEQILTHRFSAPNHQYNLEDMMVVLNRCYEDMVTNKPALPIRLQLERLPPVSDQAILHALKVCASQPQGTPRYKMLTLTRRMQMLRWPPTLDQGWTVHEGQASCLISTMQVVFTYVRTRLAFGAWHDSYSETDACMAQLMLGEVMKRVSTTLETHDGVPGRRLHTLLRMRRQPYVLVMMSQLLRLDRHMPLKAGATVKHCLQTCRPESVNHETRDAYVSLAATLRKILMHSVCKERVATHMQVRLLCLQALREVTADQVHHEGQPVDKLVAILASILTIASGGEATAALVFELTVIHAFGPMGGVRDVVVALLSSGPKVLDASKQARLWDRFAVTLCPNMLPGCSNWACVKLDGPCESAMRTRLCSGCRSVRYCCVECQRTAWVEGGHRELCL